MTHLCVCVQVCVCVACGGFAVQRTSVRCRVVIFVAIGHLPSLSSATMSFGDDVLMWFAFCFVVCESPPPSWHCCVGLCEARSTVFPSQHTM